MAGSNLSGLFGLSVLGSNRAQRRPKTSQGVYGGLGRDGGSYGSQHILNKYYGNAPTVGLQPDVWAREQQRQFAKDGVKGVDRDRAKSASEDWDKIVARNKRLIERNAVHAYVRRPYNLVRLWVLTAFGASRYEVLRHILWGYDPK